MSTATKTVCDVCGDDVATADGLALSDDLRRGDVSGDICWECTRVCRDYVLRGLREDPPAEVERLLQVLFP